MLNPGGFAGSRLKFLEGELPAYTKAVVNNREDNFILDLWRRYFKRYPVDLADNVEPTEETLASVNDNEPDEELEPPKKETMTEEEYTNQLLKFNQTKEAIKKKKQKIKRWLAYRQKKVPDLGKVKDSLPDTDDPAIIMLARLTGASISKPRLPIAYNVWGHVNKQKINDAYTNTHIYKPLPKNLQAAECTRINKALFNALPLDKRKKYIKMAKKEGDEKLNEWKNKLSAPLSTDPEDRQRCIAALPIFAQPILDLIHVHTNMQATLIVGGPEPADGGHLNIISMHAGSIKGPVVRSIRPYSAYVFSFLVSAKSECRAQALPSSNPVLSRLTGNKVSVHRADWDIDPSAAAAAPLNSAPRPSTPVPLRPASPLSAHGSPPPSLRGSPPPSLPGSPPHSPDPIRPSDAREEESVSGKKRKASSSSIVDSGAGGERGGAKKRRGMTSAKGSCVGRGKRIRSTANAGAQGSKSAPLTKSSISKVKSPTVPVSAQPPICGSSNPLPSWFTSCSTMLRSHDLGLAWLKLVGLWEAFEQQHSFKPADKQSNLSSFKRPPCIAEWLKNARRPSWRPSFKDVGEDLTPITKPGINGLLSMMATLFFWGASCGPTSAWAERLEDVSAALANLVVRSQEQSQEEHQARQKDEARHIRHSTIKGEDDDEPDTARETARTTTRATTMTMTRGQKTMTMTRGQKTTKGMKTMAWRQPGTPSTKPRNIARYRNHEHNDERVEDDNGHEHDKGEDNDERQGCQLLYMFPGSQLAGWAVRGIDASATTGVNAGVRVIRLYLSVVDTGVDVPVTGVCDAGGLLPLSVLSYCSSPDVKVSVLGSGSESELSAGARSVQRFDSL
ncbi:uncharacterized protein LACBIDRAFT_328415 [Laccaria bicolor S238N-H82]|uniref:Predicted protein n=1 Tax=Laccaria bicolor (strain S238N-H82 / ATCC MYA-4686) TaxID=486041 RepID=B0DET3_LACBS|nr:uncharacterized protein LACBIDRAFT_328415 [Laccaria bicolor S238N-H82]EDR06994.1 predicted protein [Laccaria bicolor S238N-H82]|eukprot:XP_001882367.1 predicted protein [Laccaria bicolor S238N-H82]